MAARSEKGLTVAYGHIKQFIEEHFWNDFLQLQKEKDLEEKLKQFEAILSQSGKLEFDPSIQENREFDRSKELAVFKSKTVTSTKLSCDNDIDEEKRICHELLKELKESMEELRELERNALKQKEVDLCADLLKL